MIYLVPLAPVLALATVFLMFLVVPLIAAAAIIAAVALLALIVLALVAAGVVALRSILAAAVARYRPQMGLTRPGLHLFTPRARVGAALSPARLDRSR